MGVRAQRGRPAGGFTLIEIAVVIVVLALLLAMLAGLATAMIGQQRREVTRQKLAGVETALALFVSQNRRLPCPADGRMASDNANAGAERGGGTAAPCQVVVGTLNSQTHGVVPWRTLGLAESDVTDGWGNRMTYRAAPDLTQDNAMDLTACDPGGSFDLTGTPNGRCNRSGMTDPANDCNKDTFPGRCTPPQSYTANKGLRVRSLNATVTLTMDYAAAPSTGAAYVVISHGENGGSAYNNQGILQAGSPASGTLEANNNGADVAFVHAASNTFATAGGGSGAFVDDFPAYADGNGHFDDFVLRPSILTVATKAQLGPRSH